METFYRKRLKNAILPSLKNSVEKAREDDADGKDRMVYRFILSKV